MPSKNDKGLRRLADQLQDTANRLAASIPDDVRIGTSADGYILFDCLVWTSALTRQHLRSKWSVHSFNFAGRRSGSMTDEEAAMPGMRELLTATLAVQQQRWTLATALGLVHDGQPVDLPSGEMMIDRTLLSMLDAEGIDIQGAGVLVRPEETDVGDELPMIRIGANLGKPIFVRQEGLGLPVIGTWVRIGGAFYDGTVLTLNGPLPETVIAASAGRKLGEIVGTGYPRLDDRRVEGVWDVGCGPGGFDLWEVGLDFEIRLAPDQVKLGYPAATPFA